MDRYGEGDHDRRECECADHGKDAGLNNMGRSRDITGMLFLRTCGAAARR